MTIWPKKLYTQAEVDDLLKQRNVKPSSLASTNAVLPAAEKKALNKVALADLVKKSNRIIVSISSHAFPVDFFPNTINVEESRISVINRHFLSSEVYSVDIVNISNILINTSIFFSQLNIVSKTYEENEIKINNLWTHEAIYLRRIIEGLRTFARKQIDTCNFTKPELISKLEELSTTDTVT